jgi:hypothetical protein
MVKSTLRARPIHHIDLVQCSMLLNQIAIRMGCMEDVLHNTLQMIIVWRIDGVIWLS